ncbi:transmembrane protein 154 isoform X2 [Echeneis naucrates]|uniref:transmembrane protein 154 isoform X2 n=1 Tax=Echeneis naucrates TaxID=173247 RepID=UPI001113E9EF|nr:transmembrane protein 154 isoform X2 [Echeneis naucrates]
MSASRTGNMRGLWVKTPLLLLLLLLSTLTRTVLCQSDGVEDDGDTGAEVAENHEQALNDDDTTDLLSPVSHSPLPSGPSPTDDAGSGTDVHPTAEHILEGSTRDPEAPETTISSQKEDSLGFILIVVLGVLVVVIIAMIVCGIFIRHRLNNIKRDEELRKEDPYLDGSDGEKVPMPMFEEDVPSVLELEMEELDQWMKKDS